MTTATNPAFKFFYANAGFSYDPKKEVPSRGKARCARQLASAERKASSLGFTFEWEHDQEGCMGCMCGNESCPCSRQDHETLACLCRDENGNVVASLCGICEPTREYRRVVEAELASEALASR